MKSESKKSVFNINNFLSNVKNGILEDLELISIWYDCKGGHVLSKNIKLDDLCTAKRNDMLELINLGYKLPKADSPQEMLKASFCESEEKTDTEIPENSCSFRMTELILNNYKLPRIDDKDF